MCAAGPAGVTDRRERTSWLKHLRLLLVFVGVLIITIVGLQLSKAMYSQSPVPRSMCPRVNRVVPANGPVRILVTWRGSGPPPVVAVGQQYAAKTSRPMALFVKRLSGAPSGSDVLAVIPRVGIPTVVRVGVAWTSEYDALITANRALASGKFVLWHSLRGWQMPTMTSCQLVNLP